MSNVANGGLSTERGHVVRERVRGRVKVSDHLD